jgi:triacylglycerol lipase
VAICPGFTATQSSIAWIARRMASHDFVVMTINTNSTLDQPPSRATQLMAALRYLTNSSNSTVRARVDASRLGVAGHSMGGGGTLMAARDNPSLKAAVAWVKRFMDNDTRYEPFLCGAPHTAFATATVFSDYRSTCPYQ